MSSSQPLRRPALSGVGVLGSVLLCSAGPAWAQAGGGPIAPAVTPPSVRVGDLRTQLQAYQPNPLLPASGPRWLVTPSIGVSVGVTDNAGLVERQRQADVFTVISPAITVLGDTARLKVNATYAPQVSVYAATSSQTRVDQFFNGGALATIVPDLLFLDVRGSISQQSRAGGFGRSDAQTLNRNDQIQTISLSATPYAEQRFGGWGMGRVGYSIAQTFQDARGNDRFDQSANQASGQNFNQAFATGDLTTQRERGSFSTGENFGRIQNISILEAVQYNGFGPYRGAYRNTVSTDFGYALTRTITLLAGTGYQDLRFSGQDSGLLGAQPGVRISEPIWNVGVRLLPNADSSITVGYGRRDGANSAFLDGSYSPTVRTRVFARYSTGITTDSEEQQNLLQSAAAGPSGFLQDSTTGAPVSSTSGFFGTQNGLFRLRRFSVTGLLILNRDSFTASVTNEERTNLSATVFDPSFSTLNTFSNAVVLPAGSVTNGTFGTVSWQHEFTPRLSGTASFQYGVQDVAQGGGLGGQGSSTTSISGSAGVGYAFNPTLTGSAQYRYTERTGGFGSAVFNSPGTAGNGTVVENSLIVGLRKSF